MDKESVSEEEVKKGVELLFGGAERSFGTEHKSDNSFVSVFRTSKNKQEVRDVSSQSLEEIDSDVEAENVRKIEAALFIAGRFLTIGELVGLTNVNPILLKKLLRDVEEKYRDFGIGVVHRDGKWKMDVSPEYRDMVNRLASGQSEFSRAEQETLAIIAYKQPMKQSVLIKIRGNKAYEHVSRFVEMGLVNKKKTGHTAELNLSERFYDYFHLNKGEKLPDIS